MLQSTPSIGIDISDYKLRMVMLMKHYRKLSLRHYQEIDVPAGVVVNGSIQQPEQFAALLKQLHKELRGGIVSSRNVRVGVPEQQTFITTLPVESLQPEAVEMQAIKNIPFEREQMYFATEVDRNVHTVTIAAGRKEYIDHYIEILERAGFRPVGLYNEAVALRQALLPETHKLYHQGWVVMDVGLARTTVVFVIDGNIYFTTSYPSVIQPGVVNQEHLAGVLQQIIGYYQAHFSLVGPLQGIVLCGSGAYVSGIMELVTRYANVPAQPGNPLHRLRTNSASKRMRQSLVYTTAIGLALLL